MSLILLATLALAIGAACGGADEPRGSSEIVPQPDAGAGPIDREAVTLPATTLCSVPGSASEPGARPPVPLIRVTRSRWTAVVEYEILGSPAECTPAGVRISVNSVDEPSNTSTANGGRLVMRKAGRLEFPLPPLDLPPFEIRATSYTASGIPSPTTTIPVPDDSPRCLDANSLADCLRLAETELEACLAGTARQAQCSPYHFRAHPPDPDLLR